MSSIIQFSNISKNYGSTELFNNTGVTIFEHYKIGVIGRNGSGKTTLCRMITGEEEPDSGSVEKSKTLRLSYLEQHNPFKEDETVIEFLTRYTKQEEWKCGKISAQFQIKNELLTDTAIGNLSGGFQTRVKLTAMLLREPNFLVLDEPTNFLDLNTLILLENFLQNYPGAFLIVSHDREFLKKTCEQILEIENGKLTFFPGNIEEFLAYKEDLIRQRTRYNKNIEAKQKHLQTFIDRFRVKATKAKQVQARVRQFSNLQKIEIEHPISTVRISLPRIEIRNGIAVECRSLSIGYSDKLVAKNINLQIERGEHIAIVGGNGHGKTTFLRTLTGSILPLGGEYKWSKHMDIAYYGQNVYSSLNPDESVINYLQRYAAADIYQQEILNMAGRFLFRGDDVLKNIKVLSGGERARLCLAGLLLSKKSVLVLDEPTNHLDFETVEALGAALHDYNGTILFVSHDRTFVNMAANKILDVKDSRIVNFPGTYEDYVSCLEPDEIPVQNSSDSESQEKEKKTSKNKSAFLLRKELNSKIKRLTTAIKKTEKRIHELEKEKDAITEVFSSNPESYSIEKSMRLDEVNMLLKEQENEWLKQHDTIEKLKAKLD
ncbi:ABC-F family ATP-binding cassette domain-containing protein [candidate division KSB1 bacterium]